MNVFDAFVHKYGRLPTEFDPDYLEMLRMSRYRTLDIPDLKPGKCANCGSSKVDGRKYIDFGLEVDWYGIVFLCSLCLMDIAKKAGLFGEIQEELDAANRQVMDMQILYQQGEELKESILHTYEGVKEYFDRIYPTGDSSDSDRTSSVGSNETPDSGSRTTETESAIKTGKQGTSKSPSSTGRPHVSSLADLLNID